MKRPNGEERSLLHSRFWCRALRYDTKNGCVAGYKEQGETAALPGLQIPHLLEDLWWQIPQSGNTGLETVGWKKRWWRMGTLQSSKASCKRTQHCWSTASNIVGCCMLRLFAHPVGSCFAKFETGHTFQDFCCSVRSPKRSATMYVLWFNFILGLNFIFFCFWVWLCMIMSLKQKKIKFKPRIKLNHNLCFCTAPPMLLGARTRITSGLQSLVGIFTSPQVLTLLGVVGFVWEDKLGLSLLDSEQSLICEWGIMHIMRAASETHEFAVYCSSVTRSAPFEEK